MDCRVKEARWDENLVATTVCHEHIINLKGQVIDVTRQLEELKEEVIRSSQRASALELQRDEAFAQLSCLEETRHQRDESLTRAIVLQNELNKQAEELKGLTLKMENSQLQQ